MAHRRRAKRLRVGAVDARRGRTGRGSTADRPVGGARIGSRVDRSGRSPTRLAGRAFAARDGVRTRASHDRRLTTVPASTMPVHDETAQP